MEAEDFPRGRESEDETKTNEESKRRKRTRKKTRSRPVTSESSLPKPPDVGDLRVPFIPHSLGTLNSARL